MLLYVHRIGMAYQGREVRGHKGVDLLFTDVSMISAGSDDNDDDVIT